MNRIYSILICIFFTYQNIYPQVIVSIFGNLDITEPFLLELIECPSMQRLKEIHQYGISYWAGSIDYPYSRFDHSLGVFHLVRRFGGSIHEQVAALLHDVSHTIFSHVGDQLFMSINPGTHKLNAIEKNSSYQDAIHLWFLQHTEIPDILSRYGIATEDILPKKQKFTMLEQELPRLCADRLEYILHGAFCEGVFTQQDINSILQHLSFNHDSWIFDAIEPALQVGYASLYLTENIFCNKENFIQYELAAQALVRALNIQLITLDDIHFGTDSEIWHRLNSSHDKFINQLLDSLIHASSYYYKTQKTMLHSSHACGKFRGVDPMVKTDNGLIPVSKLNKEYKGHFVHLRYATKHGYYINQASNHAMPLAQEIKGY